MAKLKFVPKPRSVMGNYIALHSEGMKHPNKVERKIPKNTVWVREDWWNNPEKHVRVKTHESVEINLIRKGLPYNPAHKIGNKFEKHVRVS